MPDNVTEKEVLNCIDAFNDNNFFHGILLQLPVPQQIDPYLLIEKLDYRKDVDGLHPYNIGLLSCANKRGIVPCTPKGCLRLIKGVKKNLQGLKAVIIGRSNLIGKSMMQILLQENCTVSIIHSKTINSKLITRSADIIISAVGIPNLITQSWIKEGAIVIDVGITRQRIIKGINKITGDVCFKGVLPKVHAISPVPGGVGPMTVSCLLENTLEAFEKTL